MGFLEVDPVVARAPSSRPFMPSRGVRTAIHMSTETDQETVSAETDQRTGSIETEAPEAVDLSSTMGSSMRSIFENLGEHASVRSVYGDPIEADGKTVIPVARVAYGFGGGFGQGGEETEGRGPDAADGGTGQGAGVGGGVSAKPVGVVEVADGETRLLRFSDRRRIGVALLAGLALGLLFGRRRYRSS